MKSNRLTFVSALGLCLLALFTLNSAEAGSLAAPSTNGVSIWPHIPNDTDRIDPGDEMTFRVNVSLGTSTDVIDLVAVFDNGYEITMADQNSENCEDCGWSMDNPHDGNYATPSGENNMNGEDLVSNLGSETILYGFKAKFKTDGVDDDDYTAFLWIAEANDSGVRVNTIPSLAPDVLVSPNPGMPTDTFSVSVTYTDADNHPGTVTAKVCETSNLSSCAAPFGLFTSDSDATDGAIFTETFSTSFGGNLTVIVNASDSHDFALQNRSSTFEVDTDKPWLINDQISATSAGEADNITFSVVYCVFDVTGSGAITVEVDISGTTHSMIADGANSAACLNGINYTVTKIVAWALDEQTVTFSASNSNDSATNVVHSSTITINDAPTLAAGTAEREGDNFIINVTAGDVNIDGDTADNITVNATIEYGSTYAMSLDVTTGNYTVTVAQADIIDERGGSRIITFETTDLHQVITNEDFGDAVTITVDTTSDFTLTPSSNAVQLAPGVHTIAFTLVNNGNSADRFTISTSSVNDWITSAPSTPILVGHSSNDNDEIFTITVTVPEVANGTIDSWTVTAVAENDNSVTKEEAGTTEVASFSSHSVSIVNGVSNADPGATVSYTFTVTNTGNAAESFAYTTNGNPGSGNTAVLGMGESETIAVSHTVPSGASAGAQFTLTFTSGAESTSATTTANQIFDLDISLKSSSENVGAVKPGDTIILTFTVENEGNGADTASASFFGDWISGNADADQAIASGGSADFAVTAIVPTNAASGSSSAVNAAVTGTGDSSGDTSYTISVAAGARDVSIAGTDSYTLNKGTSGSGTVTVTNTGVAATFAVVSMSSSLGFEVSEITLAGGASGDMTFTINADATGSAEFRIEDTIDNSFDTFTLTITAREFSTDMSVWGLGECVNTGVVCNYDQSGGWTGSAYSYAGTWATTMVYTDANGQSGTHSFDTTIVNTKPTLAAPSLSGGATEGQPHVFTFTIPTDSDGSISHFVVDFGDGESVTFQGSDLKGATVTARHTYAADAVGEVKVRATAYDNSGDSTVQEVSMTVNDRTVSLEGSSYVYNLVALFGFFILGILLAGTAFKMQKGEIAGDEEMNERDRQRLESVERRMEGLSEREELLEVSAYDASRAATKLEEHISAFNEILVRAQEIAAKEKLEELEAAEQAQKTSDEQTQMDLEDPDIEMVAERFHEALGRLVSAREELSKIEEQLAHILKMERDEQLEKLTEMTESYESTKRKIDALHSSKEARDAAAVENNITNLLSAAASGGSLGAADFGDFGDLDSDDDEYEVEIYEDEDGSFYYIDPDTGEEVPCDEDGNAL